MGWHFGLIGQAYQYKSIKSNGNKDLHLFGCSLFPIALNMWSVSPLTEAQIMYEDALLFRPF